MDGQGGAGLGVSSRGVARQAVVWPDKARQWQDLVSQGWSWRGESMPGETWLGKGNTPSLRIHSKGGATMTNMTFEPKGTKPEWELVYDYVSSLPVGSVVTYDKLTEILGREFLVARGPFAKANKRLLETHSRGLANVKGKGYRVVTAAEHASMARSHHGRARRQLKTSLRWAENTNPDELTPEQLRINTLLIERLRRQEDFTRRLDTRVKRTEARVDEVTEQSEDTAKKLQRLTETLERHGIDVS